MFFLASAIFNIFPIFFFFTIAMFVLTGLYKSKRFSRFTTVLIKFNHAEIISKLKLNRAIDFERNTNTRHTETSYVRFVFDPVDLHCISLVTGQQTLQCQRRF